MQCHKCGLNIGGNQNCGCCRRFSKCIAGEPSYQLEAHDCPTCNPTCRVGCPRWFWQDKKNGRYIWREITDEDIVYMLEDFLLKTEFFYTHKGRQYCVNFKYMTQTNTKTGFRRRIKREES